MANTLPVGSRMHYTLLDSLTLVSFYPSHILTLGSKSIWWTKSSSYFMQSSIKSSSIKLEPQRQISEFFVSQHLILLPFTKTSMKHMHNCGFLFLYFLCVVCRSLSQILISFSHVKITTILYSSSSGLPYRVLYTCINILAFNKNL